MGIMPTSMHFAINFALVLPFNKFLQRQGVHVGPESDDGPRPGPDDGDDAGAGEGVGVGDAEPVELGPDERAGVVLLEPELRVLVDSPPDGREPRQVPLGGAQELVGVSPVVAAVGGGGGEEGSGEKEEGEESAVPRLASH